MKAKELDKKVDQGKRIIDHLDLSKAKRPNQKQKRVNVDFPLWMIQSLDKEAKRLGVSSLFMLPEKREKKSTYFTICERPQVSLLENRRVE